jgi:hypothetical protein
VDVWILFWINSLQLRMERFITCTRQAGVTVVDPHVGIADLEVRHVVVAGEP